MIKYKLWKEGGGGVFSVNIVDTDVYYSSPYFKSYKNI